MGKSSTPLISGSFFFQQYSIRFFISWEKITDLNILLQTTTSVIIATIPVFSPIVAYFFFREKLTLVNIAGLFLSSEGSFLMLITKNFSLSIDKKGDTVPVGSSPWQHLSIRLRKETHLPLQALTIIKYQNLIGIFLFLPVFSDLRIQSTFLVKPNYEIISSFLFLSILASSLSLSFIQSRSRCWASAKPIFFQT